MEHSEDSEKKDRADVVLAGLEGSMSSVWLVAALSNKKPASFSSGESMWGATVTCRLLLRGGSFGAQAPGAEDCTRTRLLTQQKGTKQPPTLGF